MNNIEYIIQDNIKLLSNSFFSMQEEIKPMREYKEIKIMKDESSKINQKQNQQKG